MDAEVVRKLILERFGIRVEEQMSAYVLRKIDQAGGALPKGSSFAVMGGDARTGVPVRQMISASDLTGASRETLF